MKKLSIITINFNNLNGLKKTFDSIQSQTFQDYEWIIIDGGSTDGSKDLLIQYQDRIDYWVSEKDNGIYNAMNKGIAQAQGEYCQFLNSGDYYIDSNVLGRVFSCPDLADVNYGDQWCASDSKVIEKRTYPDKMSLSFLFREPLGHQASFFKTDVIKKNLYKENYSISADRAFFLELYVKGVQFHHIPQPIVYFDTEGIGSNPKTLQERRKQFYQIKREFFSDQVIKDIEEMMHNADNYAFVCRVKPLNWTYKLFKRIQKLRNTLR